MTKHLLIVYNLYMVNEEQKAPRSNPVAFFDERVPPEFLRKLLLCVTETYPKAHREAVGHESGQSAYLFGHFRYVHLENALRNLNYPGIEVRVRHIGNLYRIAQVVINGVLLTASSNIYDDRLPRRAHFRELLARHTMAESASMIFDLERQVEKGMEDIELYGIICHGKNRSDLATPAFVGIQFPDRPYQNILGYVDLLKRFPPQVDVPNVEPEIKPQIRIKPKRVNE